MTTRRTEPHRPRPVLPAQPGRKRDAQTPFDQCTTGGNDRERVPQARLLAHQLLAADRPERWQHIQGVANQAARIASTVDKADRGLLVAAAWLHDIGYSPTIKETGFHQLDGALYLDDQGWDQRLVALVAHHSGARFEPVDREFTALLNRFPYEETPVSDALTYADQTVGPHGRSMTVPDRIAEAIARHGPDSPNGQARIDRIPYLLAAAERVENRLAADIGTDRNQLPKLGCDHRDVELRLQVDHQID